MQARNVGQSYFQHLHHKDFARLRTLLRDDLKFEGPIAQFDRADDLVKSLEKLSKIAKGAEVQAFYSDETSACVVYDLRTDTPVGTSQVAEWFVLRDGKIASIRVHFDARPFAALFAES